jgi:Family of unknown function (DUF6152)
MKGKLLGTLCLAAGLMLATLPAAAHHGFAGRYDEEHPVTVSGTVVEFQFMNPHSAIIFDVRDASGKVERWHAELGSAGSLHRADGWNEDALKPGDKITIIGPRAKNGANDMNLSHQSKITLTDTGKVIHDSMRADQSGN